MDAQNGSGGRFRRVPDARAKLPHVGASIRLNLLQLRSAAQTQAFALMSFTQMYP